MGSGPTALPYTAAPLAMILVWYYCTSLKNAGNAFFMFIMFFYSFYRFWTSLIMSGLNASLTHWEGKNFNMPKIKTSIDFLFLLTESDFVFPSADGSILTLVKQSMTNPCSMRKGKKSSLSMICL